MKSLSKIFLALSVSALILSLTGPGSEFAWGFLKPLAAVSFITFFISNLLANEFARFDAEEQSKRALVPSGTSMAHRSASQPSAKPTKGHAFAAAGAR